MERRFFVQAMAAATWGTLAAGGARAFADPPPTPRKGGAGEPPLGRAVTIHALPVPLTIDTTKTAVLVVDMQNDFGSEGGAFQRAGIDISMIHAAVEPTARVLAAARRTGIPVVYLKMAFQPDLSDAGAVDSPNYVRHVSLGLGKAVKAPGGADRRVLVRDTWNTDIVSELTPHAEDVVMYKHRFSGFFETPLDETLKRLGVRSLIVVGCTTSICVESTIRDAMFRDYSCVLLEDCAGEPIGNGLPRTNHAASLLTIQTLLGWVSTSHDLIEALQS